MMHVNTTPTKTISFIGEEIGLELGLQFVADFQASNENVAESFIIGRTIIEKILAQPGCEGFNFHMAMNEAGEKTLVYTGLSADGQPILEYPVVNVDGSLSSKAGIVADRITRGGGRTVNEGAIDNDNWNWETE